MSHNKVLEFKKTEKREPPKSKGNQEWEDWTEGYPEKIQKALKKHGSLQGNKPKCKS